MAKGMELGRKPEKRSNLRDLCRRFGRIAVGGELSHTL